LHGISADVIDSRCDVVAVKAADNICAHTAESDHSEICCCHEMPIRYKKTLNSEDVSLSRAVL
jgi:hypothetical protein